MKLKKYLSSAEAAKLLKVSRSTASRYLDKGLLKGKKNPLTGWRAISSKSVTEIRRKYGIK